MNTRNIAIAGHGGTGKSTLAEHLLFTADTIPIPFPVASGKSTSDFTDLEIEHQISIYTSLMNLSWRDTKISLLDTPGASDFVGELVAAFRTADSAIVNVSAVDGIQIETIKIWRRLNNRSRPRMVFINKMDDPKADFQKVLASLSSQFKLHFVALSVPHFDGGRFVGTYDLMQEKYYPAGGDKKEDSTGTKLPDAISKELRDTYKAALIEAAAEGDDELLEKFLESESLSLQETWKGLMEGFCENRIVPVFAGSCEKNAGLVALLNFIASATPDPSSMEEQILINNEKEGFHVSEEGPVALFTFKTRIDQFAGKLSYIKVMRGRLKRDMELLNDREGRKEKISKLYVAQGKHLEEVSSLAAGEIGIMAKVASAHTNDSFTAIEAPLHFPSLKLPRPVYALAMQAASRKDEDKLSTLLQRIAEQDKTFTIVFHAETQQTVISGMGEMHLRLILEEVSLPNKIEVHTELPKVAYRETITKASNAVYRHKKQSGGHGQFGEVSISIKALPRGESYFFENLIRGTAISKGYIPGIEKGLHEAMEAGELAGYPLTDISISLLDGKEHSVDSSELAFKLAARGALKEAISNARPILLEPIMHLIVLIDEQYVGDVLSDLSGKRGRVLGQQAQTGNIVEVEAHVPQSTLLNYCIDLRSMTSGTGSFEVEFDHYAPLSGKHMHDVIAQAKEAS